MPIKPIEWESLNQLEQTALAAAGERSLLSFTSLWFNVTQGDSFRVNWHHHYYKWAIEQVLEGKAQNLVINIPPGGTKTEFFSVHLPVYCFVKYPRVRILNTSYSKDLVTENSSRSRSLVKSAEFQQFYPFEIDKDKVDDWTINIKGKRAHQLFSRPSGGQITGVRGGYMNEGFSGYVMADDWDKISDLFSEAKRKKSHTTLTNTLRSRRATSKTPFIFVQQRGHVDDSTAFLMNNGMGLSIDLHVEIPALINEEYIESLPPDIANRCRHDICSSKQVDGYWSYWPQKDSIDDLIALRESDPYTFMSQYMQAPESLDGGIFREEDFIYYGDTDDGADIEPPPRFEYRIITADTAQKTKEHNDFTVLAEWGFYAGKIYRLNYLRKKMEAKELKQQFMAFCNASWAKNSTVDGNLRAIYVEDKSSGTGLIQELSAKTPVKITPVQRSVDKLTRAMDCQPHVANKVICLPYGDPHNFEFISEVCAFSADDSHKHDDQTDTMMDAIDRMIIKPATGKRRFARRVGG